ncbi:MAG: MFS transporter [Thermodesulfobacteriota bacterium]
MPTERLFTKELIALNVVMFLVYCNIAVFFEFHHYLATLPLAPQSYGLLIGLFSASMLVLRPLISPFFHPGNARRWIGISCGLIIASLFAYHAASGFWSMAFVRLFHGTAHVVLATAVVAGLIGCIPPDRSAQAFGLVSVITLLPYAVIPPVLDTATRMMGGFLGVLDLTAWAMALSFPLLVVIRGARSGDADSASQRPGRRDILVNLRDPRILILLLVALLLWSSYSPVFYFLGDHGAKLGVANPGWFFTLSGFTEIGVRLAGGRRFDRLNKRRLLIGTLLWLMIGNVVMAQASHEWTFYGMGLFMGLGWGVAMPVLSGLMFDCSEPRLRALNTNLTFQMFQAGFFLGPVVGGFVLVHGGYAGLYSLCATLTAVAAIAAWFLREM